MKFLLTLFLLGGLSLSNIQAEVIDSAGLFSKNAIETADKKIQEVQTKTNKTLVFETINSLDGKDSKDVSIEKARAKKVNGVYVLIAKKEKKIEVRTGSSTRKLFNDLDARTMKEKISSGFKSGNFDAGLLDGVNHFHSVFTSASTAPNQSISPSNTVGDTTAVRRHHRSSGGFSWVSFLIVILVIFLIFRLIGAVIGMFSRGGGGGYNQGYNNGGYYGGNQGGGGMGFFGTFLTGMFGAMAGSWLYDKFTGNDSGLSASDYNSYNNDNDLYAGGSSGSDSSWSSTDDYSDYSSGDSGSYDSGDSGGGDSGGSDW